jgi:hypothetical protein
MVFKDEAFYSLPLPQQVDDPTGGDAGEEEVFFQCISTQGAAHRPKILKTLARVPQDNAREAPLALSLQYLQVWKREGNMVTGFFDSDPVFVDSKDVGPFQSVRGRLQEWTASVSDLVGMFDLSEPRSAAPTLALTDGKVPVCMVVEHLRAEGWIPMNGLVIHTDMTKTMDGRKPESKKLYFQTLLKLEDYLHHNPSIHSDQPISYFKCVMQQMPIEANLGDEWYKQRLLLPQDAMLALPAPPAPEALADGSSSDGGFDVVGGTAPAAKVRVRRAPRVAVEAIVPFGVVPLHAPPPPPPPDESSSSSSSASGEDSHDSEFDVVGRSKVSEWFVLVPDGPRIKMDSYKPGGKRRYNRYIAKCTHHEGGCTKKRNCNLKIRYGPCEPVAYLHAWNAMGAACSAAEHTVRGLVVPQAEVARFIGKIGDKAKPLLDLAAPE